MMHFLQQLVMTILAVMSDVVDYEYIKEELVRYFSNLPTKIQTIEVLMEMKQRPGEPGRLYAARYEVIQYRVNQLMAEEQT